MAWIGTNGDGRYRVLDRGQVVRWLTLVAWPFEARADPVGTAQKAGEALDRLIDLGLPCLMRAGVRSFDLCEVLNFSKVEGLAGRDNFYHGLNIPAWRRSTAESMRIIPPEPGGPVEHDPRQFEVIYRREFTLEGRTPGTFARLRLPLPYEDSTLRDLSVDVMETAAEGAEVVRKPGRLEARFVVPEGTSMVSIGVKMTFTALQQTFELDRYGPGPALPDAREAELYTRHHEGLIRVTPAVESLADSLTGPRDDARAMVSAFWAFFFDRMTSGYIHHGELDRADPLGSLLRLGWFDCYGGSALLIGMCRAKGLPARLVHGLILHELTPCFHFWAEVFLPTHGWVPFDLASWDLAAGNLDDAPWGRLLLGRMDYRMKCQLFPHLVVGPVGATFPASWHMLMTLEGEGAATSFYALDSTRPLLCDVLRVGRLPS